jgi:plasmid maintenance system antidote protein VapI
MDMIDRICEASRDESSTLAQSFEITNNTATRTLDPTTAVTADVAKVLATLITDMKRGGKNRVR